MKKNQFILQDKNIFIGSFFKKNLQKKMISLEGDIIKQCTKKYGHHILLC